MKSVKIFSILLCLAILLQMVPFGSLVASATENASSSSTVSYEDSNGIFVAEYVANTDSDYGAMNLTLPKRDNGVLSFKEGNGLRLNWQNIPGFETFDASKTYTITFDVKVTDFGDNALWNNQGSANRELYFAPGGWYNQIEMRSGGDGTVGMRAGGTWGSVATLDKVYSVTFEWAPSQKKMTTTFKDGDTTVLTGYRTSDDYGTVNKYTRSFVWRCEDGAVEIDNLTFSDGSTTYTQNFDSNQNVANYSGIWGLENIQKTDANAPVIQDGVVKFSEKTGIRFNWTNVPGVGEYDSSLVYTFEFDAKITDKGNGTVWNNNDHTRSLYVAFGGWYNLIEIPTKDDVVKIGSSSVPYSDEFENKDLHIVVTWAGNMLSACITDANGNILLNGMRTSDSFTDVSITELTSSITDAPMRYLVLRCEDGAAEIDNFEFYINSVDQADGTEIIVPAGKQAVYECDVDFDGNSSVDVKFGNVSIFSVSSTGLTVGAKSIQGNYGTGIYHVKAYINPEQEMVSVEVVKPDGGVVRRGMYTLLGGNEISVYAANQDSVSNVTVNYTDITVNEYQVTDTEPQATGFGANVYNIVTAFEDACTSRSFAWTAAASFVGSEEMAVKYRKTGDTDWTVVGAVKETEAYEVSTEDYFKCDIYGLAADTSYEYKIGKKNSTDEANDWSQAYTFKTSAENVDDFTFIAVGDTQGITWAGETTSDKGFKYAHAAINEAFEEVSDPAFILHTGDVVESGGDMDMWNLYFKALGEHGTGTAHFATVGNHDTWIDSSNFFFDYHFNHPNNGGVAALDQTQIANITDANLKYVAQNADETIYSFNYGNAHFVVLNTGSYNNSQDVYMIEAQREWLINDLENNEDAQWTVLLIHEPVYHRNGGVEDRRYLYDVIEGYGVDLVLEGHSHLVTRTYPMKNGEIVSKAYTDSILQGTGTIYTTIGSTTLNHDGTSDSTNVEEMFNISVPALTQPAYTTVSVNENSLVVTIKQVNGLVLDQFTIYDACTDPAGHTIVTDPAVAPTFSSTGLTEGTHCSTCGKVFITQKEVPCLVGIVDSWSMSLGSELSVNFNVSVNADYADDAQIVISLADKTYTYNVSDLTAVEGVYPVSIKLAAAQMTDTITVKVVSNESSSEAKEYSVVKYANLLLQNQAMSKYHQLVKNMLNYGAAAQEYFGHNTENLANSGIEGYGTENVPESVETDMAISGSADGINFYGATLVFRDKIAVRYYFKTTGEINAYTFTVDGTEYYPEQNNGLYYIEIGDINPQDLNKTWTVVVNDALSVTYGPMNYIVRTNEKGTDSLKALMKGLYNYHLAAVKYVETGNNRFFVSSATDGMVIDTEAGTVNYSGGMPNTELLFAADSNKGYATNWELTGNFHKPDRYTDMILSFGVKDESGKEQWFTLYQHGITLGKTTSDTMIWDTTTGYIFNQATCSFFWEEAGAELLNYKLVIEDNVLYGYFGNAANAMKLSWELPLTDSRYGGFYSDSKYQIGIFTTGASAVWMTDVAATTYNASSDLADRFYIASAPDCFYYDTVTGNGVFKGLSAEESVDLMFAADKDGNYARSWEVSGTLTRDSRWDNATLSFGVVDHTGKEQWFTIYQHGITLGKTTSDTMIWDTTAEYTFNQATCSFYWEEENSERLDYKLVIEDNVLKAYFGNAVNEMKLSWEFPLTDSRFGGFSADSSYRVGMHYTYTYVTTMTNMTATASDVYTYDKFHVVSKNDSVTANSEAGIISINGSETKTETFFGATPTGAYATNWEMTGVVTKNTVTDNLFYHFGVRDAANKVQWFNIYEGTLSLQNYWDWSETKQSADNVHVFESSPAYNFFYKLDDSLTYRIVIEDDVLKAYFGTSLNSLKLAWDLPLTDALYGGFVPGSSYQLAICTVDPCALTISNMEIVTDGVVENPAPLYKRGDIQIRDPFVLVDNDTYYMYGTQSYGQFEVYTSTDLEIWAKQDPCFVGTDDFWGNAAGNSSVEGAERAYWAPEVHKYTYNGETAYYMLATFTQNTDTMNQQGTAILKATSPTGPFELWSDGPITPAGHSCLDASLYIENGTPYLVYAHEWQCACRNYNGTGTMDYIQLSADLKTTVGDSVEWFGADDLTTFWEELFGTEPSKTTDGPFVYTDANGQNYLMWSTHLTPDDANSYALLASPFTTLGSDVDLASDTLKLYVDNGGHGMVFTDLNGVETLVLHTPNSGNTRAQFFTVVITDGVIALTDRDSAAINNADDIA